MGLVPVYVYDDEAWYPYRGSPASVNGSLGYVVSIADFASFLRTSIASPTLYDEVMTKRALVLKYRQSHYTFAGVLQQGRFFCPHAR